MDNDFNKKKNRRLATLLIYFGILLLILADTGYSFRQYYSQPLDGDMAGGIVPARDVRPVLDNPFGIKILVDHQTYPNPNRFFSHWMFYEYFNATPLFLQKFVTPVDSLYLSCAIAKIIIQLLCIYLFAMAISDTRNFLKIDFIIAAGLVVPLFQTNGYQPYMGIIDASITYTFFYALPAALLMLYFSPFFRQYYHLKKPSALIFIKILWIPLAIVVCLSGPLNTGVVLILAALLFMMNLKINYFQSNKEGFIKRMTNAFLMIPGWYWFYLLPISLFSAYSLYIGKFSSINADYPFPLGELYLRLPKGIFNQFTHKLGFPILGIALLFNTLFIYFSYKNIEGKRILTLFKWIGIFSLIYILLLPLGGYRVYRPYVIRFDTILPVTLSLILMFGISTLFLLKNSVKKQKIWYIPLIIIVLFAFTYSDKAQFDKNKCERISLTEISESKDPVVQISNDCNVLSWTRIVKPEDSELNAELLQLMRITGEKRLYFNK